MTEADAFLRQRLTVAGVEARVTHVHRHPAPTGYAPPTLVPAGEPLKSAEAPAEFGFVLDELRTR